MSFLRKFWNGLLEYDMPTVDEIEGEYNKQVEAALEERYSLNEAETESPIDTMNAIMDEELLCGITFWVDNKHQLHVFIRWGQNKLNEDTGRRMGKMVADITGGGLNETIFKTLVGVAGQNEHLQGFIKSIIENWQKTDNLKVDDPVIPPQLTLRKIAQDMEDEE